MLAPDQRGENLHMSTPASPNLMNGHAVADRIYRELQPRIAALRTQGVKPALTILLADNDTRTDAYVRAKQDAANRLGIRVQLHAFSPNLPAGELQDLIRKTIAACNVAADTHGIVLQLPLPNGIDEQELIDAIGPKKDVDGLTATNVAALEAGRELLAPATPLAVLRLLIAHSVALENTTVAVIGQGRLVGAPIAAMLHHRGANVRTADASTRDLATVTRGANVIVAATGTPNLITADLIDDNTVLIDVGLTSVDGQLIGDVSEDARAKARLATPVVGGVGPVTVASLLSNVILAAEYQLLTQKREL